jgi:hypothetical protein
MKNRRIKLKSTLKCIARRFRYTVQFYHVHRSTI